MNSLTRLITGGEAIGEYKIPVSLVAAVVGLSVSISF